MKFKFTDIAERCKNFDDLNPTKVPDSNDASTNRSTVKMITKKLYLFIMAFYQLSTFHGRDYTTQTLIKPFNFYIMQILHYKFVLSFRVDIV